MDSTENLYTTLEQMGMSLQEINQFIKCREKGLVVSKSIRDVDLLRTFLKVCQTHDFKFDYGQQQVILNVLQQGVSVDNVIKLANPKYNSYVMQEIGVAFMRGKDITKYIDDISSYLIPHIRLMAINGVSDKAISWFVLATRRMGSYGDIKKADELRFCLEDGVPLSELSKVGSLSFEQLREIRMKYKKKND